MHRDQQQSELRSEGLFPRRPLLKAVGIASLASGAFSLSATGQEDDDTQGFPPDDGTEWGESTELGNGEIRTFVTLSDDDTPALVGLWFTRDSLSGLPSEHTEDLLDFPATDETPFTFSQVNWNPHGHAPEGIYSIPHFDFHYYLTEESTLDEIQAGSCEREGVEYPVTCETLDRATEPLPEDQAPPGYIDVAAVEQRMGNHLIDPTALEFQGTRFMQTFIWGTFDGRLTFFEPMITQEFLEQRQEEVRTSISMPEAFPEAGWYPTRYVIRYLEEQDAYAITLEEFEQFDASEDSDDGSDDDGEAETENGSNNSSSD